jgi:hypothetical protein
MVKALLVGLGGIGFEYDQNLKEHSLTHFKAIYRNKSIELVGAVDPDADKLQKLRELDSNVNLFSSVVEVDIDCLDLIVLAESTKYRANNYEILVEYYPTAHYLMEKPIDLDTYLTRQLSEDKQTKIMINYFRRCQPNYSKFQNFFESINEGFFDVYYNKSHAHNGVHFIDLVLSVIDAQENVKILNRYQNRIFDVALLEIGRYLIRLNSKKYSQVNDYRVVFESEERRLEYHRGGEKLDEYTLDMSSTNDFSWRLDMKWENSHETYMDRVYEEVLVKLKGGHSSICTYRENQRVNEILKFLQ